MMHAMQGSVEDLEEIPVLVHDNCPSNGSLQRRRLVRPPVGGRLGVNLFRRNVVRDLGHDGVGDGVDDDSWLAESRHSDGRD